MDIVKGIEKEQDKIVLLDSLGFRPIEIAKLLNKSQDNINVQLNKIRKRKESEGKPKETVQVQTSESDEKNVASEVASSSSRQESDQK